MSQNSRNQGFSYYFWLVMVGSRSGSGYRAGSVPRTNGSDPDPGGPNPNNKKYWITSNIRNVKYVPLHLDVLLP